jgi:hypothetical protein
MIQTYQYAKGLKVMVWACFWGNERTQAYLMDRDFESKKHEFSTNSYLEVLNNQVLPNYPRNSFILMQNNASIYTAKKVKAWFKEHNIKTFN